MPQMGPLMWIPLFMVSLTSLYYISSVVLSIQGLSSVLSQSMSPSTSGPSHFWLW